MFAYCNNNPINALDPGGKAWYHWAIGAAVVLGFGALTLATCGGSLAAAATAVSLVSYGVSAGTTASTVAAAAFIGSATTYCATVVVAATESSSAQDFADQGNWYTAAAPLVSGVIAGYSVYTPSPSNTKDTYIAPQHTTGTKSPEKVSNPNGSYTQLDGKGNIYSYAQYNAKGRQSLRIDFQGRAHAGVIPHIHLYVYPERGGKKEYTFDLNWFLID